MITGNVVGTVLKTPNTLILVDGDGNEYTAVSTAEDVELTATVNDVRLGTTAALADGIRTGEKYIPGYQTKEGFQGIPSGSSYTITSLAWNDGYDFTKLQVIFCEFGTSISDSVSASKVSIDGNVYDVNSASVIASVSKDTQNKTINFNITNNTGKTQILRFFTYKENS